VEVNQQPVTAVLVRALSLGHEAPAFARRASQFKRDVPVSAQTLPLPRSSEQVKNTHIRGRSR